jgi:hypothetical protein
MGTRIVLNEAALLQLHGQLMDEAYMGFDHRTNIKPVIWTDEEAGQMSQYGAQAGNSTGGKQTIYRRQGKDPIISGGRR